jgi:predicted nuclease of restriction endonuclease-like (RecB) superfamily
MEPRIHLFADNVVANLGRASLLLRYHTAQPFGRTVHQASPASGEIMKRAQKPKSPVPCPDETERPTPSSLQSNDDVYQRIQSILAEARSRAWRAVNSAMVAAYWEVGRVIVEEEQRREDRAQYGKRLLEELSRRLKTDFGRGFDPSNLSMMRSFYLAFPIFDAVRQELSWTHYRILLRVSNVEARSFYENESINCRWSTRELERQVHALLFERLKLSRDQAGILALAEKGHQILQPSDLVKDPYVLEFTGLSPTAHLRESDLEQAIINKLQQFLLELGRGFAFMARQQRMTLDGQHYFLDLVFYNRLTRCFVLIDLKVGALTHQDLGQMQMYVNYYQRELTAPDENPPLGIVLCTDKNEAVVRYTLPEGNNQIFASRYKLYLPTEQELATEVQRERESIELQQRLAVNDTEFNA